MEDSHVKFTKIKPLACSAYPLIEINPISLDQKCKFCKECGTADKNLNFETESLLKIQESMQTDAMCIWRYANRGSENKKTKEIIKTGWVLEDC